MFNIEVQIKISQSNLSIEVVYFLEILHLDDISAGFWCMPNTNLSFFFICSRGALAFIGRSYGILGQ